MTEDELQKLLETTLPARDRHDVLVEEIDAPEVRLRFAAVAGEAWTSAALLSVADTALRAAAGVTASLSHLTVTVLRAAQATDVIALARVIRREGDSVHAEAWLFSHAPIEPMLHATATLRL